ncbi:MAG: hypothetical protein DI531_08160 [Brevundimonas sp.]|uniref:hypothetical protein n=1 Tax=Brevundimonas sp. TaxID=1871086 RepID=UPI000DB0D83A|nr:hypothetical protein [Brevundimonas sp.]PZU74136.1 MAG: hypothetical protein DI531_08160 [Brevundimonas sp.]
MDNLTHAIARACALLVLQIAGLIAGVIALFFLHRYGESSGLGALQLTLLATVGLQLFRVIPAVHRAREAALAAPTPYWIGTAAMAILATVFLAIIVFGSVAVAAQTFAVLGFWATWLVVLSGLIPLKSALEALKQASRQRGALSA